MALKVKLTSKDKEAAAVVAEAMKAKQGRLAKVKKDTNILEAFYEDTKSQWGDITC